MEKYNILLIDSDADNRVRLQSACKSVVYFGSFEHARDLSSGMSKLKGSDPIHVVFLSSSFSLDEYGDIIRDARSTLQGQSCAYVAIRSGSAPDGAKEAEAMLAGVDAFLTQPYSVDELTEITHLAAKVRRDFQRKKITSAVKLMLGEVVGELRVTAHFLADEEQRAEYYLKQFRESAESLKKLNPEQEEVYFEVLTEILENESPPSPIPDKLNYKGPSARLKRRLEAKVVDYLKRMTST